MLTIVGESVTTDILPPTEHRAWAYSGPDQLAPSLAQRIVLVVLIAVSLVSVANTLSTDPPLLLALLDIAIVVAVLVLQTLFFARRVLEFPSRAGNIALLVQAFLAYAPFAIYGQGWIGIPGFLAGSVLLALPSPRSWGFFTGIVVSVGVIQLVLSGAGGDIAYSVISTSITGLVVYGMSRLSSLVQQLQSARIAIESMAVANERLRFSRDLHDLLGYSLSAITLKSELTRHLLTQHPDRAVSNLDEILVLSRQALADVRSVADGYREMSLFQEVKSVESMLAGADIEVSLKINQVPLSTSANTALASSLREGVTNILRHSDATRCEISLEQLGERVRFQLANDGVPSSAPASRRSGSGLDSLTCRVRDLGGELNVRVNEPAGWFVLQAWVPVRS